MKSRSILNLLFLSALYPTVRADTNSGPPDAMISAHVGLANNFLMDRISILCDSSIPKACPSHNKQLQSKVKIINLIEKIMHNEAKNFLWSELIANGVKIEILPDKNKNGLGYNAAAIFIDYRNVIRLDESLLKKLNNGEIERILSHEAWHANIFWRNHRRAEIEHLPPHQLVDANPYFSKNDGKIFSNAMEKGFQRILHDFFTLHNRWFLGFGEDRARYLRYVEACKNYKPRFIINLADQAWCKTNPEKIRLINSGKEINKAALELSNNRLIDYYITNIFKDPAGMWMAKGYVVSNLNDSINAFFLDTARLKYPTLKYKNEAERIKETDAQISGELSESIINTFYPELKAAHQLEESKILEVTIQSQNFKNNNARASR